MSELKTEMTTEEARQVAVKLRRMAVPTTPVKTLLRGELGQVIEEKLRDEGWGASDAVDALKTLGYQISLRELKAALRQRKSQQDEATAPPAESPEIATAEATIEPNNPVAPSDCAAPLSEPDEAPSLPSQNTSPRPRAIVLPRKKSRPSLSSMIDER